MIPNSSFKFPHNYFGNWPPLRGSRALASFRTVSFRGPGLARGPMARVRAEWETAPSRGFTLSTIR